MAAPDISGTGSRGPVTWTYTPITKDGFRIEVTVSSASEGADWSVTVRTRLDDAAIVDDAEESATFAAVNIIIPNSEAPDLATLEDKLQGLVDWVYDSFLPTP